MRESGAALGEVVDSLLLAVGNSAFRPRELVQTYSCTSPAGVGAGPPTGLRGPTRRGRRWRGAAHIA